MYLTMFVAIGAFSFFFVLGFALWMTMDKKIPGVSVIFSLLMAFIATVMQKYVPSPDYEMIVIGHKHLFYLFALLFTVLNFDDGTFRIPKRMMRRLKVAAMKRMIELKRKQISWVQFRPA